MDTIPFRPTSGSLLILLFALAMGTAACSDGDVNEPEVLALPEPVQRDLADIQDRDTLVALTAYNSTSYFIYRGQPMGYEYEMLRAFAEDADLALRVKVVDDRDSLFHKLNTGEGDLVAARVIPRDADTNQVRFTQALYETRPAVVQRKGPAASAELPEPVDSTLEEIAPDSSLLDTLDDARPTRTSLSVRLVSRPSQLVGDTVRVPGRTFYEEVLLEVEDSLSGDIHVVQAEGDVAVERLIRQVSEGAFDLVVGPEDVAELRESYFTNITVRPTLSEPADVAWAVRQNAPELHEALDAWLGTDAAKTLGVQLYEKYYVDRRGYAERTESTYLTSETGRLSEYDDVLRKYAPEVGWDWRLLAAQTYQESRFNPRARSWAGAAGLLQLMPPTARQFGVSDVYDPDANVAGAVRFIKWLQEYWADEIPDAAERRKFILASYNTGHGHVEDARRLTEKYGDDPNVWGDVAYWLLQKAKRKYYTDPVVKYGFARGLEPVTYVALILERFDHYRQTPQTTA